jgi:hypothetical protein
LIVYLYNAHILSIECSAWCHIVVQLRFHLSREWSLCVFASDRIFDILRSTKSIGPKALKQIFPLIFTKSLCFHFRFYRLPLLSKEIVNVFIFWGRLLANFLNCHNSKEYTHWSVYCLLFYFLRTVGRYYYIIAGLEYNRN